MRTTQKTNDSRTLLEHLESQGVQVEYQCREGYCGSCRLKLICGKVNWLTTPLAFHMPDEILPCCCRADGEIKIDIKD